MTQAQVDDVPRTAQSTSSSQAGPVLLATKPFGSSEAPRRVARWLAQREERELHVVSVLDDQVALTASAGELAGAPMLPSQYYAADRSALADSLRGALSNEGDDPGFLHVDVREGDSVRNVMDAARACHARVIVIGTGEHGRAGRFLYGERAVQIVSMADRPVLIVPHSARPASVAIAVAAVDFSEASLRAARAVAPMLSPGGCLTLLHVLPGSGQDDGESAEIAAASTRALDRLRQFLRELPALAGVTVEPRVTFGDVSPAILAYAAACDAGLIACGRLGHSFVEQLFVGSVSSALVRQASCPILVAPQLPGDAAITLA